jgi:hypothetical protein
MLIETKTGDYFNTDHIRNFRIRWRKDDPHWLAFHGEFSNGNSFFEEISVNERSKIERFANTDQLQIVPSLPGYFLLTYFLTNDERDDVTREQVLAWRFDDTMGFHGAFTVFEWPDDGRRGQSILCPDGRVTEAGNQIWDTEADWTKEQREQALRERAKKAVA